MVARCPSGWQLPSGHSSFHVKPTNRNDGLLEARSPKKARFPKGEGERDDPIPSVEEKGGPTSGQIAKNTGTKR